MTSHCSYKLQKSICPTLCTIAWGPMRAGAREFLPCYPPLDGPGSAPGHSKREIDSQRNREVRLDLIERELQVFIENRRQPLLHYNAISYQLFSNGRA